MASRLGTGLLLAAAAATGWAAEPSVQQVRELLEAMHMQQSLTQMNTQVAGTMQQRLPCVPVSYWQSFINEQGAKAVVERMVPAYQHHFTAEEIDGLLKFYRSPLGQKVLTEMPAAMAEGSAAGQDWGRERTRNMLQTLQQQGTLDTQGRCPGTAVQASAGEDDDEAVGAAAAVAKPQPATRHPKAAAKPAATKAHKAPARSRKAPARTKPAAAPAKAASTAKPASTSKPAPKPAATPASGT
ncbi:DUF2059 domain-containing protein [Frateuria defendens]|uniref:DUF2059 domain-containing protein n=1 Tax=Frateuria defendens TaxID=2219559 RepID=UPI001F420CFC|nr:DUF2059 domain-containing protein [Frateuria defendens]